MNTQLPDLTSPNVDQPLRHQSSCASLSLPLLNLLNDVLPAPPSLTLSVGSGPGLLEALLLGHFPSRAILLPAETRGGEDEDDVQFKASFYGVEVKGVNRFLADDNVITVPGTWAIAEEAKTAEGLLFVYPRQPGLLRSYLGGEGGEDVRVVAWIGPRCDLDEFVGVLGEWGVEDAVAGRGKLVEDGEAVVVYRRREECRQYCR